MSRDLYSECAVTCHMNQRLCLVTADDRDWPVSDVQDAGTSYQGV